MSYALKKRTTSLAEPSQAPLLFRKQASADEMVEWLKTPVTQPRDPSSIPGTHVAGGQN